MKKKLNLLILLCLSGLVLLPLLLMFFNSFAGVDEIMECFGGIFTDSGESVRFSMFPRFPTLRSYVELLLDTPGFFVMFWNSCKQVFAVLGGQLLVSVPAAYAFAKYEFRGKKPLFFLYIILMILPFQVTMVSNYLVLNRLKLMDTHLAVILPGIFSTFPVFIITKSFQSVPKALYEAAAIDGAGDMCQFVRIGIPMAMPGIISAMVLGFLEYWNTIEQPMTFLKTKALWPLSLYLPNITADKVSVSFSASIVMMFPAILLFLWGQSFLEQGIAASGIKE